MKRAAVKKSGHDLQVRFGRAVRECRKRQKLSQEELAARSEMHRTYIADIERGVRNLTLRSMAKLACALDETVVNLLS